MNIYFNCDMFANDLMNYRKTKTQNQVAEELEINRATVSLLERGKQIPSLDIIQRFCSLAGSKVQNYFVEETQDPIMLLMGRLTEGDQPKLSNVMKRINTRLKYIELMKRCEKK